MSAPNEIAHAFDLITRGARSAAKEAFENALRDYPEHAKAWWTLGGIYWDKHEYDEAARCFRRATALRPRSEDCAAALFHALLDGGRIDEAVTEARRFLEEVAKGAACSLETEQVFRDWLTDAEGMAAAWRRRES